MDENIIRPQRIENNQAVTSQNIGRNIRYLRKHSGFTMEELARKIGLEARQLQKFENGVTQAPAIIIAKIASEIQTPIEAFFSNDPPNNADDLDDEINKDLLLANLNTAMSTLCVRKLRAMLLIAKTLTD